MKRTLGVLLQVLGYGFAAWAGLVGLGFSSILLMGYIGTSGREAGVQLAWTSAATVVSVLVGYGLGRVGRRLARASA